MLEENLVLTLLQASITGAGLVLAVYALIIPLYKRIFGYRAEDVYETLQKFKEGAREADTLISPEKLSELKAKLTTIEEQRGFPTSLSWGMGITFFGYMVSALMSFFWVTAIDKPTWMDAWLPLAFVGSTVLFLLLGIASIQEISQTMKREFEDLKKEVEDAKSKSKPKTEIERKTRKTNEDSEKSSMP
jgi:Sec-independent protein translocase protein TatA